MLKPVPVRRVQSWAAFTIIETLVVIGIITVLAAIVVPVIFSVREKGRQTACASNLRQLGIALLAYTQDYDELHPATLIQLSKSSAATPISLGWAAQIYPMVKNTGVFQCPDDSTSSSQGPSTTFTVSYALNSNMTAESDASVSNPANTVLAFEVSQDVAEITTPIEGISDGAPQISPVGDGVDGALLSLTPAAASANTQSAQYATGLLDNYHSTQILPINQFENVSGRHSNGSVFLADDGHLKWLEPAAVSAGGNANSPTNQQTRTGCRPNNFSRASGWPCAAGSQDGAHAMTFSLQ